MQQEKAELKWRTARKRESWTDHRDVHYPKGKPRVWRSDVYGTATLQSPSVGELPQRAPARSRTVQKSPLLAPNHLFDSIIQKYNNYSLHVTSLTLLTLIIELSLPLCLLPPHFILSIWHSHIEFLSCETSGMLLAIAPPVVINPNWTSTQNPLNLSQ